MARPWLVLVVTLLATSGVAVGVGVQSTTGSGMTESQPGVFPQFGQAAQDGGNKTVDSRFGDSAPPLDMNGLPPETAMFLFAGDIDDGRSTSQPVLNRLPVETERKYDAVTYDREQSVPSQAAREWTTTAFADYSEETSFDTDTARYPPHADLRSERFIADAHATLFAIQPSTIVHETGKTPTWYLTEQGEASAVVDYRERTPNRTVEKSSDPDIDRRITEYEVQSSSIQNLTLEVNNKPDPATQQSGTHVPTFEYDAADYGGEIIQLGVRAKIVAKVEVTTTLIPENESEEPITKTEIRTETVTVTDGRPTQVYRLEEEDVAGYRASGPDSAERVAVESEVPWAMLQVRGTNATVTSRWRLLAGQEPDTTWNELVVATENETETRPAPDIPVHVQAIPTSHPPTAAATRFGEAGRVTATTTTGDERRPPESVPDGMGTPVVNESYQPQGNVAASLPGIDPAYDLRVVGLVAGLNHTRSSAELTERSVRQAELTIQTEQVNTSYTELSIQLRDAQTGEPISLQRSRSVDTVSLAPRFRESEPTTDGEVIITGRSQRYSIRPPAEGTTITVPMHGIITAQFSPASWISQDPAYQPTRGSARSSRLATGDALFALIELALPLLLPMWMSIKLLQAGGRVTHPEDFID